MFAAAVDSLEDTQPVAAPLSFPVAYGVDRGLGDRLGAWWDTRRHFIQPTEFLVTGAGRVLGATYSNSPVGRMDSAEVLNLLDILRSRRPG
ncbi:MAG: hypothetical protein AAF648_03665 [Pseudomonadota bacterium]